MKKFLAVASMLLCMAGFVPMGWAEDGLEKPAQAAQESYILDGKEYTKEQLINDFISISFSDKPWPDDDGKDRFFEGGGGIQDVVLFKKSYPWFAEYILREKGYPSSEGIFKWQTKSIAIGFDWPNYSFHPATSSGQEDVRDGKKYKCPTQSSYCPFQAQIMDGSYDDILKHLKTISESIEKRTGLSIKIQLPDDPKESTESYARIRIIPIEKNRQKNFFKIYKWGSGAESNEWDISHGEADLFGAVSFTTNTRSQVDGYLLPNADNFIGMSVCKVMPVVGNEMIKPLLTECLLRAMGLPDLSVNEKAALGNWNKLYDKYSKLKGVDPRGDAIFSGLEFWPNNQMFPTLSNVLRPMEPSEYDLFILNILYCKELLPSMDKKEVREVLTMGSCF